MMVTARTILELLSTEPAVRLNLPLLGRASSMTVIVRKGSIRMVSVGCVDYPNDVVVYDLPSGSAVTITSKKSMVRVDLSWLDLLALSWLCSSTTI